MWSNCGQLFEVMKNTETSLSRPLVQEVRCLRGERT
jgi:hypothetical protein